MTSPYGSSGYSNDPILGAPGWELYTQGTQVPQPPGTGKNIYNRGNGGLGGGIPGSSPPSGTGSGADSSNGAINGGNAAFDLYGTSAAYIATRAPAGQNYMTSYYIPDYNAMRLDLYFYDFSGGIDAQIRQLADGVFSNELSRSLLASSFARSMNLPPLVTVDSTATNEVGTLEAMSACFLNDGGTPRWLVAIGDTADKCLFALTNSVTHQTYNPGGNILSLTTVKLVTNTERVIIGRAGAVAQIASNFAGSPTTTSMHANTGSTYGVIRSPLNSTTPGAETLLIYAGAAGATLYSLSSGTAAVTDAPVAVLTNWPSGGYALGITTTSTEGVARAYWVHPLNTSAASMLDTMAPGKVVSTNLEGTDFKNVDMKLPFVKHAMLWRGGIAGTDGKQIHWNNGDIIDLGWNRERAWNDDGVLGFGTIQCLEVTDERLFVYSSAIVGDTNDLNFTVKEEYIPEDNSWQFVSRTSRSSALQSVAAATGKSPVYQPYDTAVDTGRLYWYQRIGGGLVSATYGWASIPLLADGVNPNWQQAATSWISYQFAPGTAGGVDTACYADTPVYHYMGLPLFVSDIQCLGTIPGAGAKVRIEIGEIGQGNVSGLGPLGMGFSSITLAQTTQSATFTSDTAWQRRWWINPSVEAPQNDRLQLRIFIEQATSGSNATKTSPNPLPFRVGLYCYLDGNFTPPKTMEQRRYWGPREL